jgi:hypothetical protein
MSQPELSELQMEQPRAILTLTGEAKDVVILIGH